MEVTLTQAQKIAEIALPAKVQASERLRNFTFEPARLVREYPSCWVFAAPSEDMAEADYAPAALFVYIDKTDGHVWTVEEQDAYFYPTETPARLAA